MATGGDFTLRPLLLIFRQTLHLCVTRFAPRFQPVQCAAFFAMRQSRRINLAARGFHRMQQSVLPTEIFKRLLSIGIAAIQLAQILFNATQAAIERFQLFILRRH